MRDRDEQEETNYCAVSDRTQEEAQSRYFVIGQLNRTEGRGGRKEGRSDNENSTRSKGSKD
jgi:hypothetical protein